MPERQLQLFDPAKPFLDRIGPEFFKTTPRLPGVYVMTGDDERILYIGQSSNLRTRLASYKNSRRDGTPRKTLRLAHSVRMITYEVCGSVEEALLREKKLIALHKPRFNRAGVMPRAPRFISVTSNNFELELSLCETRSISTAYGPFSSGGRNLFASLCRSLWNVAWDFPGFESFPAGLLAAGPPSSVRIPLRTATHLFALTTTFLNGSSRDLIDALAAAAEGRRSAVSKCQTVLHEEDMTTLETYYRRILHSSANEQNLENMAQSL